MFADEGIERLLKIMIGNISRTLHIVDELFHQRRLLFGKSGDPVRQSLILHEALSGKHSPEWNRWSRRSDLNR